MELVLQFPTFGREKQKKTKQWATKLEVQISGVYNLSWHLCPIFPQRMRAADPGLGLGTGSPGSCSACCDQLRLVLLSGPHWKSESVCVRVSESPSSRPLPISNNFQHPETITTCLPAKAHRLHKRQKAGSRGKEAGGGVTTGAARQRRTNGAKSP